MGGGFSMKGTSRVSDLMLERYRFGDVSAEEREFVETELQSDKELRSRYEAREVLFKELSDRYPIEDMPILEGHQNNVIPVGKFTFSGQSSPRKGRFLSRKHLLRGLCAAAVLACVLFPSLYYLRERSSDKQPEIAGETGRARGTEARIEFFIYRETQTGPELLSDQALLKEGDKVQLVYTIPPGEEYYGVIFSIDGRSVVTLHYPNDELESSSLSSGRQELGEAYTLDDAPYSEIFVFVVSGERLDTKTVMKTARELAAGAGRDPATVQTKTAAAFDGCEVKTIIIRK